MAKSKSTEVLAFTGYLLVGSPFKNNFSVEVETNRNRGLIRQHIIIANVAVIIAGWLRVVYSVDHSPPTIIK